MFFHKKTLTLLKYLSHNTQRFYQQSPHGYSSFTVHTREFKHKGLDSVTVRDPSLAGGICDPNLVQNLNGPKFKWVEFPMSKVAKTLLKIKLEFNSHFKHF